MSDLPELTRDEARQVELRWQQIIEIYKFTGEHLYWPLSREKRDRLTRAYGRGLRCMDPDNPDRVIEPGDPKLFELIGREETALLAEGLFDVLVWPYFDQWAGSSRLFEEFESWLPALEEPVIRRVQGLWEKRGGWFDRIALPLVKGKIKASAGAWRKQARDRELARLNQPPLESAAATIAKTQRLLAEWQERKLTTQETGVLPAAAPKIIETPATVTRGAPPPKKKRGPRKRKEKVLALEAAASAKGPKRPPLTKKQVETGRWRKSVIFPLLKNKGWTRRRWALEAEVHHSVVYEYLSGRSFPAWENQQKLEQALGQALPDKKTPTTPTTPTIKNPETPTTPTT